jgi:hypothetical protein
VRRALLLTAATIATAVALAACGSSSSGLIPPADAQSIGSSLTALTTALANHDCNATRTALDRVSFAIDSLPRSVDRRLADNLTQGYNDLAPEARAQCKARAPANTGASGPATHRHKPRKSSTGNTGTTSTGLTGTSQGGIGVPTGPTGTTTSTEPTGSTTPTGSTSTTSAGGGVGPGGGSTSSTGSTGSSGSSGASGTDGGGAASG